MRNRILEGLRTLSLSIVIGFVVGLFTFQVAGATVPDEEVPIGVDSQVDSLFELDPFIVTALGALIIPAVIAFLTNATIAPWFKKLLTALLSGIWGIITVGTTETGTALISVSSLKSAILTFIATMAAYWGLLRNTETEAALQRVGPDVGPTA